MSCCLATAQKSTSMLWLVKRFKRYFIKACRSFPDELIPRLILENSAAHETSETFFSLLQLQVGQ